MSDAPSLPPDQQSPEPAARQPSPENGRLWRRPAFVSTLNALFALYLTLTGAALIGRWMAAPACTHPSAPGDCGPTSLYELAMQLGLHPARAHVMALFRGGAQVTSFCDLRDVASRLGIHAEGLSMNIQALFRTRPLGILHIDGHHFVALVGYSGRDAVVENPLGDGTVKREAWDQGALVEHWDGRILAVVAVRRASLSHTRPPPRERAEDVREYKEPCRIPLGAYPGPGTDDIGDRSSETTVCDHDVHNGGGSQNLSYLHLRTSPSGRRDHPSRGAAQ